uniref:Uncharacterized protein n=1 Tax=Magnetococcus massalia (strain MO-1) TaxID=451514 RepID=A0A1S7LI28_MAGMO|nr:Conserved protein of unknown function [Candidatus Magnetococcus massalia]
MTIHFNDTIRNALLNALRNYMNGTCEIYGGSRPPSPDYPALDAPLVSFTIAFNSAVDGTITLSNPPLASEVTGSGTASWFRITDGSYKLDGDITIEGEGGDAILDSLTLTAGEMVTLKEMDFTIPIPA